MDSSNFISYYYFDVLFFNNLFVLYIFCSIKIKSASTGSLNPPPSGFRWLLYFASHRAHVWEIRRCSGSKDVRDLEYLKT